MTGFVNVTVFDHGQLEILVSLCLASGDVMRDIDFGVAVKCLLDQ